MHVLYNIMHACRCPVHDQGHRVYETIEDPKTNELEVVHALKETRDQHNNMYSDCRDTPTPPLPPRGYSLSSSLDKIDNIQNLELHDLTSNSQSQNDGNYCRATAIVDGENTYQPLIPPRVKDGAAEYQSLTELTRHQDTAL